MGYTGSMSFNDRTVFSEWKSNNTFFCMEYPMTYLRAKKCKLTLESIDETLKLLHGSSTGYQGYRYSMQASLNIIQNLSNLIDGIYSDEVFNGNDFIGIIKMQNSDCYGNSQTINFYRKENISEVPSVELHERIAISEEELTDTKKKRISFINVLDVFSASEYSEDGRNLYLSIVDGLMNIKNRSDIFYFISKINDIYMERHQQYTQKYNATMYITEYLCSFYDNVKNGEDIFVSYENGCLYFYSDCEVIEIKTDFYDVSELFASNGVTSYGAGLVITDKSEFKSFVDSLSKNNYRNLDLEKKIQKLYENIKDGEDFTFNIGGSF